MTHIEENANKTANKLYGYLSTQDVDCDEFDWDTIRSIIKASQEEMIREFRRVVSNESYEWDGGVTDWNKHITPHTNQQIT